MSCGNHVCSCYLSSQRGATPIVHSGIKHLKRRLWFFVFDTDGWLLALGAW